MATADTLIRDLIADFQARSWKSEPMEKALHLASAMPESLMAFALAIMNELPKGGTFLDATLMFLPKQDWAELTHVAVTHLQADPKNKAAESVIEYASLQCPQAVHPFLSELFTIDAWFQSYTGVYAWRESGTKHLAFLADQLQNVPAQLSTDTPKYPAGGNDLRVRAFSALLETRDPQCLALACAAAPALGYSSEQLKWELWSVDREIENGVMRSLVPSRVRHLQFEEGYVERPGFLAQWAVPTWHTPTNGDMLHKFGGYAEKPCDVCGERLHHLITMKPVPENIGVTGMESLMLTTCFSCLGWEMTNLYYRHDSAGVPTALDVFAEKRVPQLTSPALKPTQVALVDTPSRWRWQEWGTSNSRENLNRLGGHPCWVQSAEYPDCPQCHRTMSFLLELDSELRLEDGTSLLWGSGGVAYLFWCDACRVSAFTSQWT